MFTVEKYDQKQLLQSYFMEHDWLWKTLVYGNILDFYFVKRLKEMQSIQMIISDEERFTYGQGLKRTDRENKKDASALIGLDFLDTNKNAETSYENLSTEVDQEIFKVYQINHQERALIDFAHDISIPLIKRKDLERILGPLRLQNEAHRAYLQHYADVYIQHYNRIYDSDGQYFEVEVWHSSHVLGMYFKVIDQPSIEKNQTIWKQDVETGELLKKFSAFSLSQHSKDLFVQKDIKGFEEYAFYVIKPNEYKNWHRAIAHLDLSEFINAIMQTENQEEANP